MKSKRVLAAFLVFGTLFLFSPPSFSELGDSKEAVLTRYREPHLQEKYNHLKDMLFWGQLDPKGKTYEFWGYNGVVNANGYGTPGKTIVFDGNRMAVFMVLCGPQAYQCQWTLRETLPHELHKIKPTVIPEEELRKKGWENERARAIFIWTTDRYYVETVVTEVDPKDWLNSKIFGSAKTYPDMVEKPGAEKKE